MHFTSGCFGSTSETTTRPASQQMYAYVPTIVMARAPVRTAARIERQFAIQKIVQRIAVQRACRRRRVSSLRICRPRTSRRRFRARPARGSRADVSAWDRARSWLAPRRPSHISWARRTAGRCGDTGAVAIRCENALSSMKATSKIRKPPVPQAAYKYSPRNCKLRTCGCSNGCLIASPMSLPRCSWATCKMWSCCACRLKKSGNASECRRCRSPLAARRAR